MHQFGIQGSSRKRCASAPFSPPQFTVEESQGTPSGFARISDHIVIVKQLPSTPPNRCRIVLTGGPGGGKTTAADLFRREIGDRVVVVPEAATILFQGGFPRSHERHALRSAQTAIFHVQRHLEDVQAALFPGRTLLCDRGTVDGAVYWPGPPAEYFKAVGTTLEHEFARYDAVIFFETAARGGVSIEGGNPTRTESVAEAVQLDDKLRALWSQHRRFILVPHNPSFFKKISFGLAALEGMVVQLNGRPLPKRQFVNHRSPLHAEK